MPTGSKFSDISLPLEISRAAQVGMVDGREQTGQSICVLRLTEFCSTSPPTIALYDCTYYLICTYAQ